MNTRKIISGRPMYGTAKMVSEENAIPEVKEEKELFWGNAMIKIMDSLDPNSHNIILNKDDSNGQHDLLLQSDSNEDIGIQVTEFTSFQTRRREAVRKKYIATLLGLIEDNNISSSHALVINIHFKGKDQDTKPINAKNVFKILAEGIERGQGEYNDNELRILVMPLPKGQRVYFQGVNNIFIDVDFDLITKDYDYYKTSLDEILINKKDSKSPWLLIWSVHFCQNKHVFGEELIEYMRSSFSDSHFEKVVFLESMPMKSTFDANLKIYKIK